ncbi:hypothetical protein C2845_PM04G13550 [Panicum miliaceum]|uniref:Zn-dependent metallo-hydrolase RNA specificity domain-containing protein n=1 Tax=Panicum miliaceum TaxID=4540 RepID=A0A3L6QQ08_PANMI|nr:hypothetical protein C2845_PM04G13550 [Panicum miliaceum]
MVTTAAEQVVGAAAAAVLRRLSAAGGARPLLRSSAAAELGTAAQLLDGGAAGGNRRWLMSGEPTRIELHKEAHIEVRRQIHQLAFSRHTESKGIMDLIEFLSPKHVILVHGEKPLMAFLKERVESELGMPCYYPANNESSPFGQPRTTKERHGKVRYKLHR